MLTDTDIQLIRGKYEADQSTYRDVAITVQGIIMDVLTRRAFDKRIVSYRAKGGDSLERKLSLDKYRRQWSARDFAETLSPPLKDLAGTRVLLYDPDQVPLVVQAVEDAVHDLGHKVVEQKLHANRDGYTAQHLYVRLCSGEMMSPVCEVQVCTIASHLWNELEHDIVYKQPGGNPDDAQRELLTSLNQELRLCERTVLRLMARTREQIHRKSEKLRGHEDLRLYLEGRERTQVRGDHEDLFDLLDQFVSPLTPRALDQLFDAGMNRAAATALRDHCDPYGALKEVGIMTVHLIQHLDEAAVSEALTAREDPPPLWRFAGSVLTAIRGL